MAETLGCTLCGTNNPVDARFCINCGASLVSAATGPTRRLAGMTCPHCGTDNAENARFCSKCGQQLAAEPVARSQPYARTYLSPPQGDKSMYCPACREVVLVMADRQGIEVDYCPNCRGVWLDRGELDKIIERVALAQGGASSYQNQHRDQRSRDYREHREYKDDYDDYNRKKKPRGLLGELFDFG